MSNKEPEASGAVPECVTQNLFVKSSPNPEEFTTKVSGYQFSKPDESGSKVDYHALLQSFRTSGFQATNVALAIEQINLMLKARAEPVPEGDEKPYLSGAGNRTLTNCTIFLGYTSNLISSGVRESLRFLVENDMVDVIVTSAGGIEEDLIKCLADTYIGDFNLSGTMLRKRGLNRIGNLIAPNDNYIKFEDWVMPILDAMLDEQKNQGVIWCPSKMISRLGKEINNPQSVYYWAYKNNIPVFCPAITDGSLGDMIYVHSYRNPGLIVDIAQDIRLIDSEAVRAVNSGMIILGGGLIKHHVCNANLMRNGADYTVFVNTAQEFDGSDAGARPDEAVSWGKIKIGTNPVKVYGENSIIFPLLVAETFARNYKDPPSFSKPDSSIAK